MRAAAKKTHPIPVLLDAGNPNTEILLPMIRFYHVLALAMILAAGPLRAEESPGSVPGLFVGLESWTIVFPRHMQGKASIVPEGIGNKPAIKVEVPEGESAEPWLGKISHHFPILEPGDYTLYFFVKVEPDDARLDVCIWKANAAMGELWGERTYYKATPDWQEFYLEFSADRADPKASISFGEMAQSGRTILISDVRLIKH